MERAWEGGESNEGRTEGSNRMMRREEGSNEGSNEAARSRNELTHERTKAGRREGGK